MNRKVWTRALAVGAFLFGYQLGQAPYVFARNRAES